jgi:hypothetical protein
MPILLQIDESKTEDPKEFKKVCKVVHMLMEKAVLDGFFKNNWSEEALEELEKYGPLDDIEVYEEDENGETTIQIGIVFAES